MTRAIAFFLLLIGVGLKAQTLQSSFSIPSSACKAQNIYFKNTSTTGKTYAWDFCNGDLDLQPTGSLLTNSYGGYGTRVAVASGGGEFFGFILSGGTQNLYRLNFGTDLNNTPSITNLGNLGLASNQLRAITIVYDGGSYYGFIIDSQKNTVYRIDFGNSLKNAPTNITSIFQGSPLNSPFQITAVADGALKFLFVTNNGDGNIIRLKFSTSYSQAVTEAYTLAVSTQWLNGVSFIKEAGVWHCAGAAPLLGQVLKMDFTNGLDDTAPVVTPINLSAPISVEIVNENGVFYLFALSNRNTQPSIYKLNYGSSLANTPTTTELTGLGFGNVPIYNLSVANAKSTWVAFAVEQIGQNAYTLKFPNNCFSQTQYSVATAPMVVSNASGTYSVALTVSDNNGNFAYSSQSLTVSGQTSSDIKISIQNYCVNNPIQFNSVNQSGDISNYMWDFGDSNTSAQSSASHSYNTASVFTPSLTVTNGAGCQNVVQDTLQVYNPPQPGFNLPTSSPICSNQSYTLTNTSTFDLGTTPTWQWSVNGTNVSTTKNLDLTIPSTSAQSITLTASIPGCSTQATNSISTIVGGPKVDFTSASTGCVGSSIKFTNATTGSATSYAWDFGDSNTSSLTTTASVTNSYASAGPYAVKLTVSNAAGCQNFVSKNISIYSNPQPAFAIEAPPFSCANYPAQFDNNTSPPTDSNIVSWLWAFGDTTNGSSSQKNPSYTFTAEGSYNVSLTATTNFGCATTLQNPITIGASPTANFKTSPACVNQGTQFIDLSTGSITSYEWAVQSSVLSGASPSPYTFKSAGSFPLTLSVTASSGCKNQVTKTVVVPVMPVMDFTVTAPCTRNPTILRELNAGGADPAVAWNWSFNGVNGGTGSPFSYTFPIVGGYSVTLTSTRQSGCVYTASKNVIINSGPIAAFTPSAQAGAAPLTVSFENNSIADTYLWSFGDADNTTSTSVSPIFTYTKLGKYKASLTANNSYGCSDTLSSEINVVIPQADLAMQSFSLVNDPTSGSSRAVVTVSNIGNIPLTNPEIKIDLAGGAIVKENIQGTVAPGKSVTSTLSLQIIPRSIDYICAIVSATSDIDPSNNEKCVSITSSDYLFSPYPNPASGNINMDWISASSEEVKVSIYKTTGELAFQQQFSNVTPGLVQLSISTTTLSNGLYLIRFEGAKEQKTFRVMVAN